MFTNFDKAWIPGVLVMVGVGILGLVGITGDMTVEEALTTLAVLAVNGIGVYFTPNKG